MNIAILGATSQIAKNLIAQFSRDEKYTLWLFARNIQRVKEFLTVAGAVGNYRIYGFEEFPDMTYDAVINCIGIADPIKQKNAGIDLFRLTEQHDNLIIDYILKHRDTRYINFSSGAVYGTAFNSGVNGNSISEISVNSLTSADYYRIAKLESEAKHRSLQDNCIIDLRVFSFFSRYIDLNAGYILCEMVRCLKEDRIFLTNRVNIVRDYTSPSDLSHLVELCLTANKINTAIDVYSISPISKFEMIDKLSEKFGLKVEWDDKVCVNATGIKSAYYSTDKRAFDLLNYSPKHSSLESIIEEVTAILY